MDGIRFSLQNSCGSRSAQKRKTCITSYPDLKRPCTKGTRKQNKAVKTRAETLTRCRIKVSFHKNSEVLIIKYTAGSLLLRTFLGLALTICKSNVLRSSEIEAGDSTDLRFSWKAKLSSSWCLLVLIETY